jgi:hypothetical protein
MGKRRSPIWQLDIDEFKALIRRSTSYREILNEFGFSPKGGNLKTLKMRIEEDCVDDSHIRNRPKTLNANISIEIPDDDLFASNSRHGRGIVKKRIIRHKLIDHTTCSECGMNNEWNDKPISFVLDHINGIPNDHRLENLRFLCPNCNSQTSTFAGRKSKENLERYTRCSCGRIKLVSSDRCNKCRGILARKVKSWSAIGRKYGVSDNAVRKWAKAYKLDV